MRMVLAQFSLLPLSHLRNLGRDSFKMSPIIAGFRKISSEHTQNNALFISEGIVILVKKNVKRLTPPNLYPFDISGKILLLSLSMTIIISERSGLLEANQ